MNTTDSRLRPGAMLALAGAVYLGFAVAREANEGLGLEVVPRTPPPTVVGSAEPTGGPLKLRLVDTGAIGILPDSTNWGDDYGHSLRGFHHVFLDQAPWVDSTGFARIGEEWRTYSRRMADYGNNGMVVDLFLELVTFDGTPDVYAADAELRARHRALQARFKGLFEDSRADGIDIFLRTDILPLTDGLETHLRAIDPELDPTNPALWGPYRDALDELFERLPDVAGVVIRIGEGGRLYGVDGSDYRTTVAVQDVASLRTMLAELLPVFERHDRKLILRTWSVGVGDIGTLHVDPSTYERALGEVESTALIVSTKYVMGDYLSHLPTNPTLFGGHHARLVEFQARLEYEAFSAFPNFVSRDHQFALQQIRQANPNVVGTLLWTQRGGPQRAGPMSLYPFHGFDAWIDANTYATSRLANDTHADLAQVAHEWALGRYGDPELADVLAGILLDSRSAVEKGLYIRPFAEHQVRLGQIDLPPLMWIQEWDRVGGWSAVLATVYGSIRDEYGSAVAEGFEAAAVVEAAGHRFEDVLVARTGAVATPEEAEELHGILASLAYEQSLLETLAWYRQSFLSYYRWLDTGDPIARADWREGTRQFRLASAAHTAAWDGNLDFPAFEFGAAETALALERRAETVTWVSRGMLLLILLAALLLPRNGQRPWFNDWGAVAALAAVWAVTTAAFSSFSSPWLVAAVATLVATFAVAAEASTIGFGHFHRRGHASRGALAPMTLLAALLLVVLSIRGPLFFWFHFWAHEWFRIGFIGLATALAAWAAISVWSASRAALGGRRTVALGGVLIAGGVTALMLAALLPDAETLLLSLDRPLGIVPMGYSLRSGLFDYVGLPTDVSSYPAWLGLACLVTGATLRFGPARLTRAERSTTRD